ncbi:hypothetical protein ACOTJB_23795 [Achromobacter xylosoxidans]
MNSPIKLPEGTHFSDADPSGPWFDAADMRAYAEQAVRDALAAQSDALRAFADRKYCVAIDYARRNEALGWVEKARTGRFGEAEFACHKNMNEAYGAHFGIHEALRQLAPPKENNHGDTP